MSAFPRVAQHSGVTRIPGQMCLRPNSKCPRHSLAGGKHPAEGGRDCAFFLFAPVLGLPVEQVLTTVCLYLNQNTSDSRTLFFLVSSPPCSPGYPAVFWLSNLGN